MPALKYNQYWKRVLCVVLLSVLLAACGKKPGTVQQSSKTQTEEPGQSGKRITLKYDLTVKAIVMKNEASDNLIQLKAVTGGAGYTLAYTGAATVLDKYGHSRLMDEVKEGDVVEAYIDQEESLLAGIVYSSNNWTFEYSGNWKFNTKKSELNIGREKYYYTDNLVILSEGEEVSLMDLNAGDILTIQGSGKKVLSVTVEQGHGYVKLEGIDDFIGGWVEIGKVIKPISEDMLIIVPEGNWDVTIVKDGYGGSIGTTVARNKEVLVDFSDVASKIVRYGAVEFSIEPADAKLYIAGREMDYGRQILLEYETYKIRISADGYKDYTGDLRVDKALVKKRITLDKDGDSENASTTEPEETEPVQTFEPETEVSSTEDPSKKEINGYKIKVNTPKGASVYFDDSYMGIAPVSFTKVSGEHTITLSKNGYMPKSYSVDISAEQKDVTFELPELQHAGITN